jgi:hypothetical protein
MIALYAQHIEDNCGYFTLDYTTAGISRNAFLKVKIKSLSFQSLSNLRDFTNAQKNMHITN